VGPEGAPAGEKMERETGFVIPGTKTRIEFAYRLTDEDGRTRLG
jgi:hypothetical protein